MPRAKRSAETTEEMRDRLIEAVRAAIGRNGIAGVTARGLAQELGWAVGTIYTLAPSLDALTLEANARELDALGARLEDVMARHDGAPATDRVRALATAYLEFAEERPRNWSAIFERGDGSDVGPPEWYRARQEALFSVLETALAPLSGSPAEARRAARAFWAALQGFWALAMAGHVARAGDAPEAGARRELAAFLIETLLAGLSARRGLAPPAP